jgi:hypothetical protein
MSAMTSSYVAGASLDGVISGMFMFRHLLKHASDRPLSRHELNHSRPAKCTHCDKSFPTPKDLDRHNNSVHDKSTARYLCLHRNCNRPTSGWRQCCDSVGFTRKYHWKVHMAEYHHADPAKIKAIQENGIPTVPSQHLGSEKRSEEDTYLRRASYYLERMGSIVL